MEQITVQLDDIVAAQLAESARRAGLSVSEFIARIVTASASASWPPDVLASFGTWTGFPSQEQLRASFGSDAPRHDL